MFPSIAYELARLPCTTRMASSDAPVVVAALQAGKYVISEKPLAPSVAVATKTIDAAKEANALGRWGVAENYRFEPAVERLASADIGTVRSVRLSVGAPITGENPYAKTAWRQSPAHVGAYAHYRRRRHWST